MKLRGRREANAPRGGEQTKWVRGTTSALSTPGDLYGLPYVQQRALLQPPPPLILADARQDSAGSVSSVQMLWEMPEFISGNPLDLAKSPRPSSKHRSDARSQQFLDRDGGAGGEQNATIHKEASIEDARNGPKAVANDPERDYGMFSVKVIRSLSNPLENKEPTDISELADIRDPDFEEEGYTEVIDIVGSVQKPMYTVTLVDGSIFIRGSPSPLDVYQGHVGDCYLLAVLSSIADQNPERIKQIISVSGKMVNVVLYHRKPDENKWTPTFIQVDFSLAHDADTKERGPDSLKGAGFRIGEAPEKSRWHAQIPDSRPELDIFHEEFYESALWVPLLEKAYARFAEEHGNYGDDGAARKSGYEVIRGGEEHKLYPVFFGDAVKGLIDPVELTHMTEGGSPLVENNVNIIMYLLLMLQNKSKPTTGPDVFLTASSSSTDLTMRLKEEMTWFVDRPDLKNRKGLTRLKTSLAKLTLKIDTWLKLDFGDPQKAVVLKEIGAIAQSCAELENWPKELKEDQRFLNLIELLIDVGVFSGDGGKKGQRFVLPRHAYSVIDAVFMKRGDLPTALKDLNPSNIYKYLKEIDPRLSKVTLFNPHHKNEPDSTGVVGCMDGEEEGMFVLNLEQFFRNFTHLDIGTL